MKRKLFTITALAALATLAACQREAEVGAPQGPSIALEIAESPLTKVDVAADNGECTWTNGDAVGLWVTNSSTSTSAYRTETVNSANNSITPNPALTTAESVTGYAIYPDIMRGSGGTTPTVNFLSSYSMSERDLSAQTFSYVPMMAEGNDEVLRFYHVGALMRLILSNVPAATNKVRITFTGMSAVTGTSTVSNPGSAKATTGVPTSGGNVVTFTDVTPVAAPGKTYLNIPLPTIDFSALTQINVEALDGDTVLAAYVKDVVSSWGTLKHGWGRVYPVDFGNAPIEITSSPATIWKSQTTTYTATSGGVGLTWQSDDEDVATVNDSGVITAVGAGEANITALTNGGACVSAPVKVYVNEVTAISAITADKTTIGIGGTASLSVTITHTANGTIASYPNVSWASGTPAKVTVSPASSTPVFASFTTATASATATGVVDGVSSITASVAGDFTTSGSALSQTKSITCEEVTTITGGNGTFRGKYIAPGFLQYSGGSYSLTSSELDGLASVMAAYGTAAGRTKHYFNWTTLSSAFGTSGTSGSNLYISGVAYNDGDNDWYIPTQSDWDTIINGTPAATTKVGNTTLSKGFVQLVVNLDGSTLDGEGLTTNGIISSAGTDIADGGTVNRTDYIAGLLLIPDGATVTCPRMKGTVGAAASWSTSTNCITYADLKILVEGGCVFLPAAGRYYASRWFNGGNRGHYWSASEYTSNTSYACYLDFDSGSVYPSNSNPKSSLYFPVRLVR